MRGFLRYICAFLAVVCLLGAAAAGLVVCMTTETFARCVNDSEAVQTLQQQRIDQTVAALGEEWGVSADTLAPWTENAAIQQAEAVAAWWGALWQDAEADTDMPVLLDSHEEAVLVADVRRDEGFIARTAESRRRAIARDEIAYVLDEAVCDAVTPLRRSILEMGLEMATESVELPMIRKVVMIGAGALALAALVLLILAHRMAGSTLVSAGLVMALLSVPVWLADIPGMLAQLSDVAVLQGANALWFLGMVWYGAAAALMAAGVVLMGLKRLVRRNAE